MKPPDLNDFMAAAAEHLNGDNLPTLTAAIVASGDVMAAYAPDFILRCAAADEDVLFAARTTLRKMKDFSVAEFDKRVKRERLRAFETPANGHAKDGWKALLLQTDKGTPRALLANAMSALRYSPEWKGVLAFDEMGRRSVKTRTCPSGNVGAWADVDDIRLAEWLQHQGINVGSKIAFEASGAVAMETTFHPVRDYLKSLEWDRIPRIQNLLPVYFGTKSDDFIMHISAKWMLSAVARAMKPSCQVDTCLVLEGVQGIRKSSALRALTGNDSWFTDQISELFSSKDASQDLLGKWIIEIKEIDKLSKHEMGVVKGFMDRRVDHYRPSYGRRSDDFPRHNVFSATTNKREWAVDETGGRRWWPAWCEKVDISAIERDRDQLWAEAFSRYSEGNQWHLPPEIEKLAAEEQQSRFVEDSWQQEIRGFIERIAGNTATKFSIGSVSIQDILIELGLKVDKFDQFQANRVARCLVNDGWVRFRETGGERPWRYRRPTSSSSSGS